MRVHCDSQGYHVYKKIGDPNWINIWGYVLRKKKIRNRYELEIWRKK